MSGQWKPGDVAINAFGDIAILVESDTKATWVFDDDSRALVADPHHHFRPLVAIDPEDREQVECVAKAFFAHLGEREQNVREQDDAMQAALRSLIEPPKPDEPTGLGAVVENERGHKFVRVADPIDGWMADKQWQRIGGELNAVRNFGWREIGAVRVLSDGVQP